MVIDWNPMDSPFFRFLYTHGVVAAAATVVANPSIASTLNSVNPMLGTLATLGAGALVAHAGSTALATMKAANDPTAVTADALSKMVNDAVSKALAPKVSAAPSAQAGITPTAGQ